MQAPKIPLNETQRLQALHELKILDTAAEERFDRLTRLAKHYFQVPTVLISLVDANRQWFKSKQGLDACETTREISFCGHAILQRDVFFIPDARQDKRFADNPLVVGAPYIVSYAGMPLLLNNGYCVGTLCLIDYQTRQFSAEHFQSLRDLAALVQQELVLKDILHRAQAFYDSENRLHAIVDNLLDGIVTIDSQGVIYNINPMTEHLFGYHPAQLINKPLTSLILMPHLLANLSTMSSSLEPYVADAQRQDGSNFPIEFYLKPLQQGTENLFVCFIRDISERTRIERIKSEFVSTVSHELRTPLTSIRGALALVLGKASLGMSDKAKLLLETASRNSERLTLLINDILDLEKIESGHLTLNMVTVDLLKIAQQAVIANEGYAAQHQVSLVLKAHVTQAMVHGDEHRLLQVFANLISNAVKYSPAHGVVEVSLCQQQEYFKVSVKDYGQGIPEQFRAHIFNRFAQADSSDTRAKGGTGLGLSITKAIIERHGGTLAYQSQQGVGTEFYFILSGLNT
ncbi:MAG: ATP-binding protein [Agitococcus sp.]